MSKRILNKKSKNEDEGGMIIIKAQDERLPRAIINGEVKGRRRGRPLEWWIEEVKRSIMRRELEEEDIWNKVK